MSLLQETSRNKSNSNLTLGQRSRTRHSTAAEPSGEHSLFRTGSMAAASTSTRSADLSQRVNRVEEGIYEIKDQLKELISIKNPHASTSMRQQSHDPLPRPPQRYLEFERELRRADPPFEIPKGKDSIRDFFVSNPVPRPYMFLTGPGFRTPKDKIAHRDKMTFTEYVLAFTHMLLDKRACRSDEWPELVNHLNQVACDAQSRPWENVRSWSDHIFSRIESGDIAWSSRAEIQFDRMRMSLAPPGEQRTVRTADHQNSKTMVCSDYNARRCKHRDTHEEGQFTLIHVCAWCHAALGNRNPHTVVKCENKMRFGQDRQQNFQQPGILPQPRQQQQQPHLFQQPPAHQNQQQQRRQVYTSAAITNQQVPQKPKNDM